MILVDIYVPSIDKTYDFQLNENTRIDMVIDEISEMVGQKEHAQIVGDLGKLLLCDKKRQKTLSRNKTLVESGIVTGDSLLLI